MAEEDLFAAHHRSWQFGGTNTVKEIQAKIDEIRVTAKLRLR